MSNWLDDAYSLAKRAAGTIAKPYQSGYHYLKNAETRTGEGLFNAMFTTRNKKGFFTGSEIMKAKTDAAGNIIKNAAGEAEMIGTGRYYDYGKMAAGLSGLGIGYRFLSGGGLYRDKNGNFDVAGVPFI